ncbi:methyltransferase, TIGR00027 family [Streptoalloteichus hindustanus]|uniref:Methyltransferase, TIGR00027 family n=2 Tax=Streptoalloteichus hindustanus TaxID=2017 RepID=A0A1M5EXI4_STRHI|nr:methyltransferase, TIGR00027 family [Streptoalloteichus hindustanus]
MLVTLYLRAVESREPNSILRDHRAAELVSRIDYDFGKLRHAAGNRFLVALRARQLDDWAADFLRRHPDATVVQLGCGLDSRAFRLDPPARVRWFDLDQPDVIALHRRLYPESDRYRTIAASVTDPDWLDQIPSDRPTLVIAEGLLMYLAERDIQRLLCRLTDRFPHGELLFDGVAPWMSAISRRVPQRLRGGYPSLSTPTRDGRQLERGNPRLRYRDEVSLVGQYPRIPVPSYRAVYWLLSRFRATRNAMRLFRFEF